MWCWMPSLAAETSALRSTSISMVFPGGMMAVCALCPLVQALQYEGSQGLHPLHVQRCTMLPCSSVGPLLACGLAMIPRAMPAELCRPSRLDKAMSCQHLVTLPELRCKLDCLNVPSHRAKRQSTRGTVSCLSVCGLAPQLAPVHLPLALQCRRRLNRMAPSPLRRTIKNVQDIADQCSMYTKA